MKKFLGIVVIALIVLGAFGTAFGLSAYRDEYISGRWKFQNNITFYGDIAADGISLNGVTYTWPAADGTNGYQLTTNGSGTLSWAAAAGTWDTIGNAAANKAFDFTGYYTSMDFGDTDHDMLVIQGTAAFGDYSIVKIEQATGDPTNGTVLEVVSADTDCDALVVNANSTEVLNIGGAGTVAINGTEFDVSGTTGAITINDDGNAGFVSVEGSAFNINTLGFTGAGTVSTGAGTSLTLDMNTGNVAGEDLIVTAHNLQLTAAGKLTLSPDAAETLAIDLTDTDYTNAISVGDNAIVGTTGIIDYTNFDVAADGDVTCVDLTASGNVNVGTFQQDALVPASAAPHTITLDGAGAGGVTIGATSTGNITLGDDIVVSDTYNMTIGEGSLTIDDDQNETALTVDSDVTNGTSVSVISDATDGKGLSVTCDSLTGGACLYLDATEGAGLTGYYIHAYDGTASDFAVKRHGEIEITGAAGDMISITTGNLQMTAGDIDVDDGVIEINTDEDEDSYITRAFAGAGSAAAFTVTDSNAATTQPAMTVAAGGNATTGALTVNQTGTGNAVGIDLNVSGDYAAIDIDAGAARDGDVIDILMTNMLDERALVITGAITVAAGEGLIDVQSTGQIAATGSLLRLDNDTAQAADGSDGYILNIDDDTLVAATPVVYAALIDSNANGALHVSKGVSLFAEAVTFTAASVHNGGLTIAEDIDINFNAADEEINLTNSAEMDDDLAQVTIYNSDSDLTDGDLAANMYLLRLIYADDGDADGAYLSCEDNDGDEQLIIDANGALTTQSTITAEGTVTVNGAQLVGDGATEQVGFINDVVDGGATNPYTVTVAMSGTVFLNSQAIEFDIPDAATGLEYTFVVGHASNLDVDPAAGDTINYSTCGAGDKVRSATVGDTITLIGTDAGNWFVKSVVAGDGDFTDTVWTDAGP